MNTSQPGRPNPLKPRYWPIAQLPGISAQDRAKLEEFGITTTRKLLQNGRSQQQRLALANQLGIHIQHVNKWMAMAELACVPNVGCEYCGLLLHAGVASVSQLAALPIHRLHQQLLRVQVATLQRRDLCPSVDEVVKWIQQAQIICKG